MTGKQRFKAALTGKMPDRVPLGLFFNCDYKSQLAGLTPQEFIFGRTADRIAAIEALARRHDEDWIQCDPGIAATVEKNHELVREKDNWIWINKDTAKRYPVQADLAVHADEWNSPYAPGSAMGYSFATMDGPRDAVKTPADARRRIHVRSADEIVREGLLEPLRHCAPKFPERYMCMWGGNLLFNTIYFFGDMEPGMIASLESPQLFRELLEINLAQEIEAVKAGARLGADGIWIAEMLASPDVMSPEFCKNTLIACQQRLVAAAHAEGLQTYIYLTGDSLPNIPLAKTAGFDGIIMETLNKRGSEIDVGAARKIAGDDLTIFGNIDPIRDLWKGTRASIRAEVKRQIETVGRKGRFITHCNIISLPVKAGNIDVLIEANREFGRYG